MRTLLIGSLVVSTLLVAACGSDDPADDPSADTAAGATTQTTGADDAADVPSIVGESVEDATATLEEAGLTLRVLRRDGEDLPGTMDLDPDRVNVAVETQDGTEVVIEVISVG